MALIDNLQDPGSDAIFGIQTEYRKDIRDFKVNLTVGVYVEDNGAKPPIMATLKKAEGLLLTEEKTKSYLSISGDEKYLSLTAKLVFGDVEQDRIAMMQTVGGTSALRLGFEFLRKNGYDKVSVSDPTWANHKQILGNLDYEIITYPHIKAIADFTIIREHLQSLPKKTVVLLQAKSHNPTGLDFTKEQWKEISSICKEKDLFPFFDSAYQGFSESLTEDAWPIRLFLEDGHGRFVAHSFSKSFAIYNERVGAFFAVLKEPSSVGIIKRNLMRIVRVNYSNPPAHGAAAIRYVLSDATLTDEWTRELSTYRTRINSIREKFSNALIPIFGKDVSKNIKNGHGFFCLLPLNKQEISRLKEEFGVYMTNSGRISLPGLSSNSFDYVIDSIRRVKEG